MSFTILPSRLILKAIPKGNVISFLSNHLNNIMCFAVVMVSVPKPYINRPLICYMSYHVFEL